MDDFETKFMWAVVGIIAVLTIVGLLLDNWGVSPWW